MHSQPCHAAHKSEMLQFTTQQSWDTHPLWWIFHGGRICSQITHKNSFRGAFDDGWEVSNLCWTSTNTHIDKSIFCHASVSAHLCKETSFPHPHHSLLVVQAGEHVDIVVFAPEGIQRDRELGSRGAGGFLGKVGLTLLLQSILGCPQVLKFLCCFLAHQMEAQSPNTAITVLLWKCVSLRGGFSCGAQGVVPLS